VFLLSFAAFRRSAMNRINQSCASATLIPAKSEIRCFAPARSHTCGGFRRSSCVLRAGFERCVAEEAGSPVGGERRSVLIE
jgi:hypothetical protein